MELHRLSGYAPTGFSTKESSLLPIRTVELDVYWERLDQSKGKRKEGVAGGGSKDGKGLLGRDEPEDG